MRISFDLDDTLIFKTVEGPVDDSLPPLQRSYMEEKLRAGTRELMLALAQRGHARLPRRTSPLAMPVVASLREPRQAQSLQHSLHLAIECGRSDRWVEVFQCCLRLEKYVGKL